MYRTIVPASRGKIINGNPTGKRLTAVRTIPACAERRCRPREQCSITKLRVAGYCRVSTNEQSQESSAAAQELSIREMILKNPAWEFRGVYKDINKSGTSRRNRDEFNRMMEDAKAGKIDYIITKSISRFARNTVDALNCVKELRNLNPSVGVVFMKEHIFTLDPKYDIFVTIFSALAQNESYSIAENIRWGIRKRFRRGIPQINLNRMLGYDMGKDGRWVINQDQAEIVRYIYNRYLQGHSAHGISEELNDSSIKTINGKNWCTTGILCILENEKYVGDLLIQKTYTKDVLNHRPVENNGELPRYYILNHHEAIISREDWIEVQKKICSRARKRKEFNMVQRFILEESRMLS